MDLRAALHEHFGFAGFRPGQEEACAAAAAGRDVLLVMPTGAGKSLCYQLPALMRDDLSIVVSPLVSLMQDQVDALHARGLGDRVALVNAQQDAAENADVLERAGAGSLRLLYVAPERFSSPGFIGRLRGARIGLFVVDEAHCVSQWGHDFRPDYFRLADAARALDAAAVLASTATATPRVALDVAKRLRLRDPARVVTGFDRPNLSFAVSRPAPHRKLDVALSVLGADGALPALVYTGTRAGAEELAKRISDDLGRPALPYHAGLDRRLRADTQRRFLADDLEVVVATNAFGMGVDKPNVRTVLHASVPSSLEAYYQEAGRGGRDGAPARAVLLAENRDKALHVHFIKRDELDEAAYGRVAARLAQDAMLDGEYSADAAAVSGATGCAGDQLRAVLGHLARAGVIEPSPAPRDRLVGRLAAPFDRRAAGLCRASAADAVRVRWRQYREIWAYVEGGTCRREAVLHHFGDTATPARSGPCCDVCEPALAPTPPPAAPIEDANLDEAIVVVARTASPRVGRTTCAEILHGARTRKIARNSYDGLPVYGTSAHMRRADILARIDAMIEEGAIAKTAGPYPVLEPRAA